MQRILLKAKKELLPHLKEVSTWFQKYMEIYPPPLQISCVFELSPAKTPDGRFAWSWPSEMKVTDKQMAWKGIFDSWLNGKFPTSISEDIPGILVRILKDDETVASPVTPTSQTGTEGDSKLIKGEGLATFTAVKPRFQMDDLIVPPEVKEKILNTIAILKNTDLIYNVWGFGEVEPFPKAVLNFFGPPGTGKTMAAHCIANALGKNIIVANFAEIESKYVGDSPKNLENIFTVAKEADAVLFFDEADSFLGKRLTSISSSSDQAVNSLRSKLLQLLEEHTGIVVFCTNLLKNYDKAFESRILRSLKFDLPDTECRKKLISQKIPSKLPFAPGEDLSEEALSELAEIADGLSGREIKNAVLQVLCKAASEGQTSFQIADFKVGFETAQKELEILRKERGEIDKKHAKELETKIGEKLANGDFCVAPKTNDKQESEEKVTD